MKYGIITKNKKGIETYNSYSDQQTLYLIDTFEMSDALAIGGRGAASWTYYNDNVKKGKSMLVVKSVRYVAVTGAGWHKDNHIGGNLLLRVNLEDGYISFYAYHSNANTSSEITVAFPIYTFEIWGVKNIGAVL